MDKCTSLLIGFLFMTFAATGTGLANIFLTAANRREAERHVAEIRRIRAVQEVVTKD